MELSTLFPLLVILLPMLYLGFRYVDNKYLRPPSKTGFGRGAPGFQTSVQRIAVPRAKQPDEPVIVRTKSGGIYNEEWIPQTHLRKSAGGGGASKKGKKK